MKTIILLSAAYLNGGGYVDAGAEVPVGDDKLEMTEERAADMVKAKLAEVLPDEGASGEDASGEDASGEDGKPKPAAKPTARAK